MDSARIAELLHPFGASSLSPAQLQNISTYIDLLLKWNARMNLTAVRAPDEIVTRHFGESLFAARHMFPQPAGASVIDIGSGAGFPGLPIKIWNPAVHLVLIESNQKKATFLKEICRTLTLMDVDVFNGRAEQYAGPKADAVTLRAVEKFGDVLPSAVALTSAAGRLVLLIGAGQIGMAKQQSPTVRWQEPIALPLSAERVLLMGTRL